MQIEARGAAPSGATGGRYRVDSGPLQGRDVESDMQNCGFVAAVPLWSCWRAGAFWDIFFFFNYSDPIDC